MNDKRPCLLAFHAHPDDESSKGAGTMARYAHEGVRVVLVCATGGEEGDIQNPHMDRPGIKERMAELRRAELETACHILGVEEIYFLGYRDSGMPDTPSNSHPRAFCNANPDEVLAQLVEIIRTERADVVLSYDESRGYEHPDHTRVHELGRKAFHAAGDAAAFPESGSAWQPAKLYYFATFSRRRITILHEAALEAGIESPYAEWFERWDDATRDEPAATTQIDVSAWIETRSKALLAHATQIDPDGFWFAIPDDLQRRAYPWEDFVLVESTVPMTLPEKDLFAGIPAPRPSRR